MSFFSHKNNIVINSFKFKFKVFAKLFCRFFLQSHGPIRPGSSFLKANKNGSDGVSSTGKKASSKAHSRRSKNAQASSSNSSERADKKKRVHKDDDLMLKPLKKKAKKKRHDEVFKICAKNVFFFLFSLAKVTNLSFFLYLGYEQEISCFAYNQLITDLFYLSSKFWALSIFKCQGRIKTVWKLLERECIIVLVLYFLLCKFILNF